MRSIAVALALAACSSSKPDECAAITKHLAALASTDLDKGAAAGWAQQCTSYTAGERECLAHSDTMLHAYACLAARLNHDLADKAAVAANEARDDRAQRDPACAALWEHHVALELVGYGSAQAAEVRTNLENMPDAELFAHACPSYPAATRSCMTAATTPADFDRCYTAKQRRCMSDSYTVAAYDACMR